MSRPTRIPISSGTQGWDGDMDDNFAAIFDAPFPIHRDVSITEANVATTYAPGAYEHCIVWVNHTVYGYTLYYCDGTSWIPCDPAKRTTKSVTGATTLTSADQEQIILCSGALPYTVTLPTAASMIGRSRIFKTLVAGTLTIDGNGAETIDGAANATITVQYGVLRLFSNGTTWFSV